MEMFTPVKIRLHPLTRIVPANGTTTAPAPSLEARIEFTDQFNDAGKGIGTVAIQLLDTPALGTRIPLGSWTVSLNEPPINRDHWDRTTRTYLFRFPLPPNLPQNRDRLTLSAVVTLPNNNTLTDEMTVPLR
jgi:hypothetical protein